MALIHPRGDPASRIWIILDHPFPSDIPKGYCLSGGMGFVFEKMFGEAGLSLFNSYVCARKPDTDDPMSFSSVEQALDAYRPPFIVLVNETGSAFIPELRPRSTKDTYKTQLNKYVGSLLSIDRWNWPHYAMPMYGPDKCAQDWRERNICTYIDFQKLRDEFEFWKMTGTLKPLRERKLIYDPNLDFGELCSYFDRFRRAGRVSCDIETIYPKADSAYYPHPGYAHVVGLADSPDFAVSFRLFRDSPDENCLLWRELDSVFSSCSLIGQNFFNFDSYFLRSLGFSVSISTIEDTLIRHHILWPELSHKLQFLTRQYTRQPYYKDEGKHWSMKHISKLMHYNALDASVTYEVYNGQEEEFVDRPYLKGKAA